jgi:hypothetical protein
MLGKNRLATAYAIITCAIITCAIITTMKSRANAIQKRVRAMARRAVAERRSYVNAESGQ